MRDAIVDGTLAPGSALRPDDVASRLGLSRAPVRDALARLAADGLVETKPQSYTRVTEVVEKDVRDATAVIAALHDLAVRTATLTLQQIDLMRTANGRFAAAVRSGDLEAALEADDELHAIPVLACGNAAAAATIERYSPLIRRAERLLFGSPQAGRSVRLHDELIDALATGGDAVAVNQAIWGHLHHSVAF